MDFFLINHLSWKSLSMRGSEVHGKGTTPGCTFINSQRPEFPLEILKQWFIISILNSVSLSHFTNIYRQFKFSYQMRLKNIKAKWQLIHCLNICSRKIYLSEMQLKTRISNSLALQFFVFENLSFLKLLIFSKLFMY